MAQCLRFVITGDDSDEKAIRFLKQAAKEAEDAEIDVGWIAFDDLRTDPDKCGSEAVIVCEAFEGDKFEKLKSEGRRIVGPACVSYCLRNMEPLPLVSYPVMALSMRDVVVCCTNISIEKRSELKERVLAMGGIMIGDFTQSVTHLLAGEVGSKKYKVACEIGIPVVEQSWVHDCWNQSRYTLFEPNDELTERHLCPCFKGLTICVTGLGPEVRKEVAKLAGRYGGKYSGELNMRTCTHLLVKVAKGEKYDYARHWKIHCVSSEWFYDCVKEGHWIDESAYEISPGDISKMDDSKILDLGRSVVDMTTQNGPSYSVVSTKAAQVAEKSIKSREITKGIEDKIEDNCIVMKDSNRIKIRPYDTSNLRLSDIKVKSSMLLDGCKIYLSGLSEDLLDQIRKLINTAGGMRFNILNSNVTHIIIGEVVSSEVRQFLEDNIQKPFVVSPDWLVDSCRLGEVMKEEDYCLLDKDENETIVENLPKVSERKEVSDNEKKIDARNAPMFQDDDDLEDDVFFGQYLPQAESSRIVPAENKFPAAKDGKEKEEIGDELQMSGSAEAIAGLEEDLDQTTRNATLNNKVFQQYKFALKFFEKETEEEVKSLVQEVGGKIVNQEARADFVIVPLTYEKKRRVGKKEATICWLQQSIEAETLLDKTSCFLFRPFHLPPDCLPLQDVVMTVSQFSGVQREHLIQLGDLLGALMQDSFVRKATKDLRANTHLLLAEASGNKFEAACKWGVKCVTKEWLFACGEKKKLVPAEDYHLKNESVDNESQDNGDEEEEKDKSDESIASESSKADLRNAMREEEAPARKILKNAAEPVVESTSTIHPLNEDTTVESREQEDYFPANHEQLDPPKTPGKPQPLLQREKPFRPSFDIGDVMEYLKSPATCFTPNKKGRDSRSSFAFDEFVGNQLRKAVEITGGDRCTEVRGSALLRGKSIECPKPANGILKGVVVAVSKKLASQLVEIVNMVCMLGADYRHVFDSSCTHLIHRGKPTDYLREVKQARTQGKFIVSKFWLDACLDNDTRVPEEQYPCTYNPNMTLSVVSKGKTTRASKSRSSQKSKSENAEDGEGGGEEDRESVKKSLTRISGSHSMAISDNARGFMEDDTSDQQSMRNDDIDGHESKGTSSTSIVSPPALECTSSLDDRLEFKRQMEEFMEATKGNKGGIHRNRRQLLSSGLSDDDSRLKRSSVARRLRSRHSSQTTNSDALKIPSERKQNSKVSAFPAVQPSQGDVITYDDPAGRQERERILAQLKAASPSQDGFQTPADLSELPVDQIEEPDPREVVPPVKDASKDVIKSPSKVAASSTKHDITYDPDHLPTPPHRPVNMHIANPVQQPAPVNLLEESDKEEKADVETKIYKFILSAMSPQEKIHYSAMIESLGGVICDAQHFTSECSHVVIGAPSRNEKFLASVAAGKWVLHKSYLEASREAGFFVSEEDHEWGTEQDPTKLAMAVRRWRQRLSKERESDPSAGAFKGWHVLLSVGSSFKQHGFKRILEAGGGTVGSTHPPFRNVNGVTHAFVESSKKNPGLVEYDQLYSAGIWVLRPDYIADYLTQDPPPPAQKFVVPEVQKLMEAESKDDTSTDTKKRKIDEDASSQKLKRTRK